MVDVQTMLARGAGDRASGGLSPTERVAIDDLFARVAWALDTRDEAALSRLFTADALIDDDAGTFHFEGPEAALEFSRALASDPTFPGRQHWAGQTLFLRDGDVLLARSFGMAPHLHAGLRTNFLAWLGFYEDTLVSTDGRWQIKARRFHQWKDDVLADFPAFPPERGSDPASAPTTDR
jgi:hypothetical protein